MKKMMATHRNNQSRWNIQKIPLECFAGCSIAAIPVLAPYRLFGLPVSWILGAIFLVLVIIQKKKLAITIKNQQMPVYLFAIMAFVISINGLLELQYKTSLINSLIALCIELVIYITLWNHSDVDNTMKYAKWVGYACCGYAIFQMLMLFTGKPVPLGKLPFFTIPASQGWVPDIWGFRFNSLFSEPSYFAIYLLPLFTFYLMRKRWTSCFVFAAFIVLSSSSLGILAMAAVLFWFLLWDEFLCKGHTQQIVMILCGGSVAIVLCFALPQTRGFISATVEKLGKLFTESNDLRLAGHIEYFDYLPFKEQLFGTGVSQLQNYFADRGISLSNYSNSFVMAILNFGVFGAIGMALFLLAAWKISIDRHSLLFFIIFVLILAADSILFSYRYYYLIYFIWNYSEKEKHNNENFVCNAVCTGNEHLGNKK